MRKQYIYQHNTFRFRRWSRKGYAAFFSLTRAVTIGQLSSNVAERFQVKNGTVHASVLLADESHPEEKESSTELLQGEPWAEALSGVSPVLLWLFTVPTTRQMVAAASSSAYTLYYILKRDVSVYAGTSRFFIS